MNSFAQGTTMPTLEPHVLAIDDDADMRKLIADYLGQNDLRVTTVATGADMEKALAERAIDVVVLDLRLAVPSRLHNAEVYDRSIDVQILRLRRKIETDPTHPEYIKTERGVGYFLDAPVEVLH